eukprot:39533-Chlamydomonas_euryale.AAC.1
MACEAHGVGGAWRECRTACEAPNPKPNSKPRTTHPSHAMRLARHAPRTPCASHAVRLARHAPP